MTSLGGSSLQALDPSKSQAESKTETGRYEKEPSLVQIDKKADPSSSDCSTIQNINKMEPSSSNEALQPNPFGNTSNASNPSEASKKSPRSLSERSRFQKWRAELHRVYSSDDEGDNLQKKNRNDIVTTVTRDQADTSRPETFNSTDSKNAVAREQGVPDPALDCIDMSVASSDSDLQQMAPDLKGEKAPTGTDESSMKTTNEKMEPSRAFVTSRNDGADAHSPNIQEDDPNTTFGARGSENNLQTCAPQSRERLCIISSGEDRVVAPRNSDGAIEVLLEETQNVEMLSEANVKHETSLFVKRADSTAAPSDEEGPILDELPDTNEPDPETPNVSKNAVHSLAREATQMVPAQDTGGTCRRQAPQRNMNEAIHSGEVMERLLGEKEIVSEEPPSKETTPASNLFVRRADSTAGPSDEEGAIMDEFPNTETSDNVVDTLDHEVTQLVPTGDANGSCPAPENVNDAINVTTAEHEAQQITRNIGEEEDDGVIRRGMMVWKADRASAPSDEGDPTEDLSVYKESSSVHNEETTEDGTCHRTDQFDQSPRNEGDGMATTIETVTTTENTADAYESTEVETDDDRREAPGEKENKQIVDKATEELVVAEIEETAVPEQHEEIIAIVDEEEFVEEVVEEEIVDDSTNEVEDELERKVGSSGLVYEVADDGPERHEGSDLGSMEELLEVECHEDLFVSEDNLVYSEEGQSVDLEEEIVEEVSADGSDGSEYEYQVVEKFFKKDDFSTPEEYEAAINDLIPIVYKDENVDVAAMKRRTPLPELYSYLKQMAWYQRHKSSNKAGEINESVDDEMVSRAQTKTFLENNLQGLFKKRERNALDDRGASSAPPSEAITQGTTADSENEVKHIVLIQEVVNSEGQKTHVVMFHEAANGDKSEPHLALLADQTAINENIAVTDADAAGIVPRQEGHALGEEIVGGPESGDVEEEVEEEIVEVVSVDGDDGSEYEYQVVEKFFKKDEFSSPEEYEAAIDELIPIVYKDEDVDIASMKRRSPLPELYAYLKQMAWYKRHRENGSAEKNDTVDREMVPQSRAKALLENRLQGLLERRAPASQMDKPATALESREGNDDHHERLGDSHGGHGLATVSTEVSMVEPEVVEDSATAVEDIVEKVAGEASLYGQDSAELSKQTMSPREDEVKQLDDEPVDTQRMGSTEYLVVESNDEVIKAAEGPVADLVSAETSEHFENVVIEEPSGGKENELSSKARPEHPAGEETIIEVEEREFDIVEESDDDMEEVIVEDSGDELEEVVIEEVIDDELEEIHEEDDEEIILEEFETDEEEIIITEEEEIIEEEEVAIESDVHLSGSLLHKSDMFVVEEHEDDGDSTQNEGGDKW